MWLPCLNNSASWQGTETPYSGKQELCPVLLEPSLGWTTLSTGARWGWELAGRPFEARCQKQHIVLRLNVKVYPMTVHGRICRLAGSPGKYLFIYVVFSLSYSGYPERNPLYVFTLVSVFLCSESIIPASLFSIWLNATFLQGSANLTFIPAKSFLATPESVLSPLSILYFFWIIRWWLSEDIVRFLPLLYYTVWYLYY